MVTWALPAFQGRGLLISLAQREAGILKRRRHLTRRRSCAGKSTRGQ